ncbi:MAG TPA: HEAT repeat domain-containing protein [Methanothrix sp.]|nr:HEAT repeat domain-containing protein [Methanothrix sp.]
MDKARELVSLLGKSDDYFERQKAAWALVNLGEAAVDEVAGALESGEFSDLRYKSAWILGKIGSSRAVEPLCRALLSDPDHVVREWSAAALEALGKEEAASALALAMKRDSAKDVRMRAAMALRSLRAWEALRGLLSHSEPEIRGMAATGLAKMQHTDSLSDVARLLEDEDAEVRRRAAAFMGEAFAPEAPEKKSSGRESPQKDIKAVKDIDCKEPLICLEKALQDKESTVRCEAVKSLGRIRGEAACDMALSALKDEDWDVRYVAVTTLGEIGHKKALDRLVEVMFGAEDEEIRAWAAWSLGEIGDERAIEPLQKAYKTCPLEVMKKAKDSLEEVFKVKV